MEAEAATMLAPTAFTSAAMATVAFFEAVVGAVASAADSGISSDRRNGVGSISNGYINIGSLCPATFGSTEAT